MARLRIEKPGASPEGPNRKGLLFGVGALIILFLGAFFVFRVVSQPVPELPSMEIRAASEGVEIFDTRARQWRPVERNEVFSPGERIRTAEDKEAEISLPGMASFRLKPASEVLFFRPSLFRPGPEGIRLLLDRGTLFAVTETEYSFPVLQIETPQGIVTTEGGYIYIASDPRTEESFLGVLRGRASLQGSQGAKGARQEVGSLEVSRLTNTGFEEDPRRVSRDEWAEMREVYELIVTTAAREAEQLDLSKRGGSFFEYVFDHGTFYTPKLGYSRRNFYRDESLGEVRLEVEYDVFPRGSFVGMYNLVRDLDLVDYSHLEFEMRRVPGEGHPQMIRLELKGKMGIVRSFAAKSPQVQWKKHSFPLNIRQSTPLTELTLVFLHDRVGEFKRGGVEFRSVNLVPVSEPEERTVVEDAL